MLYYDKNKVYISEELYYTIYRKKRRVILAPCDELKKKQQYIKRAINWVYPLKMNILKSAQTHRGRGKYSGNKWILKLDIKDFYGSVPYEHIEQVMNNVALRIKNVDANNYLRMTTVNGKLPTGAPTSAHIANACFQPLDNFIRTYCNNFDINYSRYMDDMTFSADEKFYLNMVEEYVTRLLKGNGYCLNKKKTKYISDNKQQNVLGLVVNGDRVRLPKEFKRKIRAMVHSYTLSKSQTSPIDIKHRIWGEEKLAQLKGYLAYIKNVDTEFYNILQKQYMILNLHK